MDARCAAVRAACSDRSLVERVHSCTVGGKATWTRARYSVLRRSPIIPWPFTTSERDSIGKFANRLNAEGRERLLVERGAAPKRKPRDL